MCVPVGGRFDPRISAWPRPALVDDERRRRRGMSTGAAVVFKRTDAEAASTAFPLRVKRAFGAASVGQGVATDRDHAVDGTSRGDVCASPDSVVTAACAASHETRLPVEDAALAVTR